MIRKQASYVFCDTAKAEAAGILKDSRRKSIDGTIVILHEDDFNLYFPVINEETGEIARMLEEKARTVDGRVLTAAQARREVQGEKWNDDNNNER